MISDFIFQRLDTTNISYYISFLFPRSYTPEENFLNLVTFLVAMIVIIIIISLCLADCCFCKNEKDDEVSGGEDSVSPVTPVMARRPESWPDPILTNNMIAAAGQPTSSRPATITGARNNVNKHYNNSSKQKAVVGGGGAAKHSHHSSQMSIPQVPTVSL